MMSGYLLDQGNSSMGEVLMMRTLPLTDPIYRAPTYGNSSIFFKHIRHKIEDVLIVSARNGLAEEVYRNATPVAQECVLAWCVKTIKSSYNQGDYSEVVIDTVFNTTSGAFPWHGYPFEAENMDSGTEIFYMENVTIKVDAPTNEHDSHEYGVANITAFSLAVGFEDIFPAFTTMADKSATPIFRYKASVVGPSWTRTVSFNPWMAPNNVTKHMERLATALTNIVRSSPSHQDVEGSAWAKETFISVRWQWLIFPFLLLILSLVFLVSTIIKTSKDSGASVWKTSAMPTLIYSLPKETQGQLTKSSTWSSAKETKKVRIKLLPDRGWRVSGASHLSTSPQLPRPAVQAPHGWI
jgi:hypothetical protein